MRKITIIILIVILGQVVQVLGQTISDTSNSCELKYDSTLNRSYYASADKMPTFRGGQKELLKTINKNLKSTGGRCDMEGTVLISCIIEPNGQLSNKRILKGLGDNNVCNADKEALKVIDFLTNWTPGKCGGENVAVQYVIPVRFKIVQD